jgi:hypothetical protein
MDLSSAHLGRRRIHMDLSSAHLGRRRGEVGGSRRRAVSLVKRAYGRPGTPLTVRAVNPLPVTSTSILLQAAGGALSLG